MFKYYIMGREDLSEELLNKSEPLLLTAIGHATNGTTVLKLNENLAPAGLPGLTQQEFLDIANSDSGWIITDVL